MQQYVIKDVMEVFRYLPYGIVAGIVVAILLSAVNGRRVRKQKKPISVLAITCFFIYLIIVVCITLLSRESGSRKGMDLQLFSTWGINDRNNAFVVENVLLFIPYGFVSAWALKCARKFPISMLFGFLTSLGIESIQLATQRGYFQVDDIATNVLGNVIGYFLFLFVLQVEKKDEGKAKLVHVVLSVLIMSAAVCGVVAFTGDSTSQPNELSRKTADYIVRHVDKWLDLGFGSGDKSIVIRFLDPLLRKAAFATEYGALAVIIGFCFQMMKRSRSKAVNYIYAVLICGIITMVDVLLQKYVFYGDGKLTDAIVNICGAVVGGWAYMFLDELFVVLAGDE